MTLSTEIRDEVRQRAGLACEYCGVTESSAGGRLTIDHFQPRSCGGGDNLENLICCCTNCNMFKAAYWPRTPSDPVLWNPRREPRETHFVDLPDGTLEPVSPIGTFTLARMRLNRPQLVTYRYHKLLRSEEERLIRRNDEIVRLLKQLHDRLLLLLDEQQSLLNEQSSLLRRLVELQD